MNLAHYPREHIVSIKYPGKNLRCVTVAETQDHTPLLARVLQEHRYHIGKEHVILCEESDTPKAARGDYLPEIPIHGDLSVDIIAGCLPSKSETANTTQELATVQEEMNRLKIAYRKLHIEERKLSQELIIISQGVKI